MKDFEDIAKEQVQKQNKQTSNSITNIQHNNSSEWNNSKRNITENQGKPKNKWIAALLCLFLGLIGAHKFYEGKIAMGILYIATLGLCGIGALVDFIVILTKPQPYYVYGKHAPDDYYGENANNYSANPNSIINRSNVQPIPNSKPVVKKILRYPNEIDGCALAYCYVLEFSPKNGVNIEKEILGDCEKFVEVEASDGVISLVYDSIVFGEINNVNKAKMVKDFKKRGEPCHAILLADGKTVNLRFYKDKFKALANHERDIVKLRNYKSTKRQEIIEGIDAGDELEYEEDDEQIRVEYFCDTIGRLPASIEKRVFDDGEEIAAIFLDHIEEIETDDDGDVIFVPYVTVIWE